MNEDIISSNRLLDEKRRDMRAEIKAYRLRALDTSTYYANAGLRTLVVLNTGALGLVPTFIKSFNIIGYSKTGLFISMFFFVLSICALLRAYLSAYLQPPLKLSVIGV
jgi:hypothetical protein